MLAGFLLATSAPPSAAPQAAPLAATTPAPAPVDPARLAAAIPVVDRIWPLGTYRKMMNGMMDTIMQSTMSSMFKMKMSDLAAMGGTKAHAARAELGDRTMGDVVQTADPAFRERMGITMHVMMGEMTTLMTEVEPEIRAALARAYARRFTDAQLHDLDQFFASPTGSAYAGQAMLIYTDPEMLTAMQAFTPRLMRAMPEIMKKVAAATASLPSPPRPAGK